MAKRRTATTPAALTECLWELSRRIRATENLWLMLTPLEKATPWDAVQEPSTDPLSRLRGIVHALVEWRGKQWQMEIGAQGSGAPYAVGAVLDAVRHVAGMSHGATGTGGRGLWTRRADGNLWWGRLGCHESRRISSDSVVVKGQTAYRQEDSLAKEQGREGDVFLVGLIDEHPDKRKEFPNGAVGVAGKDICEIIDEIAGPEAANPKLTPAEARADTQYQEAKKALGSCTDSEAFDWLCRNTQYDLQRNDFRAWVRNLGKLRQKTGTQKRPWHRD